jgi:hypothetical protein
MGGALPATTSPVLPSPYASLETSNSPEMPDSPASLDTPDAPLLSPSLPISASGTRLAVSEPLSTNPFSLHDTVIKHMSPVSLGTPRFLANLSMRRCQTVVLLRWVPQSGGHPVTTVTTVTTVTMGASHRIRSPPLLTQYSLLLHEHLFPV